MRFLEAQALLRGFTSDVKRSITLCTSGRPEPLDLFLRAEFAARGVDADVTSLPFGTLQQYLRSTARGPHEAIVLLPWDLAPALDWRSGVPAQAMDAKALRETIAATEPQLAGSDRRLFYLPADIPPVASDPTSQAELATLLEGAALRLGALRVPASHFSLSNYLASGAAFASAGAGELAALVASQLAPPIPQPKKVLLTDLDGVMWRGVIGEDGPEGISSAPEGEGYAHFLYQTLLRRLRAEGTLLAVVSKNDADLARLPFRSGAMPLAEADFVAVLASYEAKSAQIMALASVLSLPTDAMVFVDDNPVEIAEVTAHVPGITTMRFPHDTESLAPFLRTLAAHFAKGTRTDEDATRTEMYRTLLAEPIPTTQGPAAVDGFLRELGMRLRIADRSGGGRERALQLINKTNQFNLNGRRLTEAELRESLARGGTLLAATLEDRNGSHGEILACIIEEDGTLSTFVMSCRVLQRRVEYAFLAWLAEQQLRGDEVRLRFNATDRNTPLRQFLRDAGFTASPDGIWSTPRDAYLRAHGDALALFAIEAPQ